MQWWLKAWVGGLRVSGGAKWVDSPRLRWPLRLSPCSRRPSLQSSHELDSEATPPSEHRERLKRGGRAGAAEELVTGSEASLPSKSRPRGLSRSQKPPPPSPQLSSDDVRHRSIVSLSLVLSSHRPCHSTSPAPPSGRLDFTSSPLFSSVSPSLFAPSTLRRGVECPLSSIDCSFPPFYVYAVDQPLLPLRVRPSLLDLLLLLCCCSASCELRAVLPFSLVLPSTRSSAEAVGVTLLLLCPALLSGCTRRLLCL